MGRPRRSGWSAFAWLNSRTVRRGPSGLPSSPTSFAGSGAAERDVARDAAGTAGAGQERDRARCRSIRRRSGMHWRTPMRTAGDPAKAGAQMATCRQIGRPRWAGQTWRPAYRLRGGGFLFQAGKFDEAELAAVPGRRRSAACPVRAKAGMLRCLARGRALALGLPGASTTSYTAALRAQIRDFPRDPSTDEARWLLGRLAVAELRPRPGPSLLVGDPVESSALARLAAGHRPSWIASSSTSRRSTPTGTGSPSVSAGRPLPADAVSSRPDPRTTRPS